MLLVSECQARRRLFLSVRVVRLLGAARALDARPVGALEGVAIPSRKALCAVPAAGNLTTDCHRPHHHNSLPCARFAVLTSDVNIVLYLCGNLHEFAGDTLYSDGLFGPILCLESACSRPLISNILVRMSRLVLLLWYLLFCGVCSLSLAHIVTVVLWNNSCTAPVWKFAVGLTERSKAHGWKGGVGWPIGYFHAVLCSRACRHLFFIRPAGCAALYLCLSGGNPVPIHPVYSVDIIIVVPLSVGTVHALRVPLFNILQRYL